MARCDGPRSSPTPFFLVGVRIVFFFCELPPWRTRFDSLERELPGFRPQVARVGVDLLSQAADPRLPSEIFPRELLEEASGYVKVLSNCHVGFSQESAPGTIPKRLIKGHLEIGRGHSTRCALVWGSHTGCTLFKKHVWPRCEGERRPFSPFPSPTGGSRGLVQGRLWRRDGVLAVSCAQEGMIRVKPRVSESKL